MTCQRCKAEASVHLTESVDGRMREVHLCDQCARKTGLAMPPEAPDLALDSVVQGLIVAHVGELVSDLARKVCPLCGMKFMEVRIGGRLGCPNDYQAFARGLLPLLKRAQEGVTRHVGKTPRRPSTPAATEQLKLRALLREAVSREDYEEAAKLRDQLLPHPKDAER